MLLLPNTAAGVKMCFFKKMVFWGGISHPREFFKFFYFLFFFCFFIFLFFVFVWVIIFWGGGVLWWGGGCGGCFIFYFWFSSLHTDSERAKKK
jgi:hypothetical protein